MLNAETCSGIIKKSYEECSFFEHYFPQFTLTLNNLFEMILNKKPN